MISTSQTVYLDPIQKAPASCNELSIGSNACWRLGADTVGNLLANSDPQLRAPDYAIVAVSLSGFGGVGTGSVAVTCDGNLYVGAGDGLTLGTTDVPSVTGVLGFGWIGNPLSSASPSNADIDGFVSGYTASVGASLAVAGVTGVYSPDAPGPSLGFEMDFGDAGISLSVGNGYALAFPGDTQPAGTCQAGGVLGSPVWQALTAVAQAVPGLGEQAITFGQYSTSGVAPTVSPGVPTIVSSSGYAPGTDVTLTAGDPITLATQAASPTGAVAIAFSLPADFPPGPTVLTETGWAPDGSTRTLTENVLVTATAPKGYWEVATDGGIFSFGDAAFYGSMGGTPLNKPIVGMASTSDGKGYWEVATDGGIFAFGDAQFYGSMGGKPLNQPIVGMASTPDGKGYWEVASDGGIFSFGDAAFYGSMGGKPLNQPIVGMASTPDGKGYWEVATDGGIFSFGDAAFYGSMGGKSLNQPIVGMASTPDGKGYWEVASDGGIFSFGDAAFYGSMGGTPLNKPIVGMASTPDGKGYWEVASDGGIFAFGDAAFYGSMGGTPLNQPIVGMAA